MNRRFTITDGWWLFWIGAAWLVVLVVGPLFFYFGPELERRFNPVVSKLEITSIEPQGDGALITGRWIKRRDCQFVDMIWSGVGKDGWQRQVYIDRRPSGRRTGRTLSLGPQETPEPWFVHMRADKIKGQSVVTVFYRCHPLWQSTVEFYP